MPLIDEAIRISQELDLAVFPVNEHKRPLVKGWPQKATRDPAEIEKLFSMPGAALVGVPAGPDNDIMAFDLDFGHDPTPEERQRLQDWLSEHGAWIEDNARLHQTRSGGLHVVTCYPERHDPPRLMAPKFEVIREGFFFVWPTAGSGYEVLQVPDVMDEPPPAMMKPLGGFEYGDGGSLMSADEADETMRTDGAGGARHDALLRMTQDWASAHPELITVPELCASFADWFTDIYGGLVEADRMEQLLEWRVDERSGEVSGEVSGELGRAMAGVTRSYDDGLPDAVVERAAAKMLSRNTPLAPKVTDHVAPEPLEIPDGLSGVMDFMLPPPPPREWLLGTYLIKGHVTMLVAPGGTGKSMLALLWAQMLATGSRLIGEAAPHHPCKVHIWSGEDDTDEMRRRMYAIIQKHETDRGALSANIRIETALDRPFKILRKSKDTGVSVDEAAVNGLIKALKDNGTEVLILDPMIALHGIDENSNEDMDLLMDQLVRIAREANVAVLVVHHVAKGSLRDDKRGDPADAARGATAIINRARIAIALRVMTAEEAAKSQIAEAKRFSYVQILDAKSNMAQRAGYGSTDWFELVGSEVGNPTEAYPGGDIVGVPIPYDRAELMITDLEAFVKVIEAMQADTANPAGYRRNKQHPQSSHWLGLLVRDACGLSWGEYSKASMRSAAEQQAYERAQEIISEMQSRSLIRRADVFDDNYRKRPGWVISDGALDRIEKLREQIGLDD
jgi:hypothetical protein